MQNQLKKAFFTVAFYLCTALTAAEAPSDLTFIYKQILENHPGMYNDTEDPAFCTTVTTAYARHKEALNNGIQSDSAASSSFIQDINDPYLRLVWNNLNMQETAINSEKKLSIEMLTDTLAWINLPTFLEFSEQQLNDWQTIRDTLPQLASEHTLVFDLRNNRGGIGYYGLKLIKALFSKDYYTYYRTLARKDQSIEWRASLENILYIKKLIKEMPLGKTAYKATLKGMKKAYKSDLPYYHELCSPLLPTTPAPALTVSSKIIVVINESTYSSALFFLDTLQMMDYPILVIGKQSDADGLYTDVRPITLPSSTGTLRMPMKTYQGAFHPGNVPHVPDIIVPGDINDTAALQDFVKNQLLELTDENT